MRFLKKLCALLLVLAAPCCGYKVFQESIPNADRVPHPCKPNYMWPGVGHHSALGGGPRNPFGRDFDKSGKVWNECLCKHDSDGDGKSNGEELGDPDCVWIQGSIPENQNGISHPGICEPHDSELCGQKNAPLGDFCSSTDKFECDSIHEPDVEPLTLRFPKTSVPAKETTYICQSFLLPVDEAYHMVAYEPLIDNKNVMHHIVLFACDNVKDASIDPFMAAPKECGMELKGCPTFVGIWTLGSTGDCVRKNEPYGFRLGKGSWGKVMLQFHWNNPALVTDYEDSSGLILHLTPKLREYDSAVLAVGPLGLHIPAGHPIVTNTGYCPRECTQQLSHSVNITAGWIHMHYLGKGGSGYIIRNGQRVSTLVETDAYSYDSPEFLKYTDYIEFRPGDEIQSTCNFKSTNRKTSTFWGGETSQEMCFIFLTYYPAYESFKTCYDYYGIDFCETLNRTKEEIQASYQGCDFNNAADFLTNNKTKPYFQAVREACDTKGLTCSPGCQAAIDDLKAYNHNCTRNNRLMFLLNSDRDISGNNDLSYAVTSCDKRPNFTPEDLKPNPGDKGDPGCMLSGVNHGSPMKMSAIADLALLLAFVIFV